MLTRSLFTSALIITAVSAVHAQDEWLGRPGVAQDSVARSIREAEARGSRHPRATANNIGPAASDNTIGRSTERRCMVTGAQAVQSGDFTAGPFASYNDFWRQGYGKLWWHPSEMGSTVPVLTVHATRLDQEAESRVFEASEIAWPSGPGASAATSTRFYPTGIRLPSVGRWMLIATAGNNWGCFIHTID